MDLEMLRDPTFDQIDPIDMNLAAGESQETDRLTTPPGELDAEMRQSGGSDGICFRDGQRRIDFVLAYQANGTPSHGDAEKKRSRKREHFEAQLVLNGLELEYEGVASSQDGKTSFVKVHCPWEYLARTAEILQIRMPLKGQKRASQQQDSAKKNLRSLLGLGRVFDANAHLTAPFRVDLADQFRIGDRETFFSPSQRIRMLYESLLKVECDPFRPTLKGIDNLLKKGVYVAAYPLHEEGSASKTSYLNERQYLRTTWASPFRFASLQPLDRIREYFGEKISFYFSWLGFYTFMLFPAAIVGVVVVIYGVWSVGGDIPVHDICNSTGMGKTVMCPLCDRYCDFWTLNITCIYTKITHVFDNYSTPIFSVFMSIWATLFLEMWKRRRAIHQWEWDVKDMALEEDHIRPEYLAAPGFRRKKNPVTEVEEPDITLMTKAIRFGISGISVLSFLAIVLIFVVGVILYRLAVGVAMYQQNDDRLSKFASIITSTTAAIINLILIIIASKVYTWLAWKLTEAELPRTRDDFENSYTFKVFLFQFVNFYSSLFYIAFFKGRFATSPKPDSTSLFFGYRPEQCHPAGCLVEVMIQLATIMVGKQILNNCQEVLFPVLTNWWHRRGKKETADNSFTRWEKDFELSELPILPLFDEYLEMVIQYGFVTLFVAAFPLAPLFALLNNIIEIRLDAFKFVSAFRRPVPARAKDLGVWFPILEGISNLAVITNACVIAFTSDFVPRLLYMFTEDHNHEWGDLSHFVEWSLSHFAIADFNETGPDYTKIQRQMEFPGLQFCRYKDYRKSPCALGQSGNFSCGHVDYAVSKRWWMNIATKLAFVLVFEHFVFLIKAFFAYLIPDIPRHIRVQQAKETVLAKKALMYQALRHRETVKPAKKRTASADDLKVTPTPIITPTPGKGLTTSSKDIFHYSPKSSTESMTASHLSAKGLAGGGKKSSPPSVISSKM